MKQWIAHLETWTLINAGDSKSLPVSSDALTTDGMPSQQNTDADSLDVSVPLIAAGACPSDTDAALAGSEA